MDAGDEPVPPELRRQNSSQREEFLIKYTTDKAVNREEIELEEGW